MGPHAPWLVAWMALVQSVVLLGLGLLSVFTMPWWGRVVFQRVFRDAVTKVFAEPYTQNLAEGLTALRKFGVQWTIESELRAQEGMPLGKPIGTARAFPHFDGLLFSPAQLRRHALDNHIPVSTTTIIGRNTKKPLVLSIPILVTAMGYGVALSKPFTRALMKGAALADTASNTGQGPCLPEFRQLAKHLVVQYHASPWRPTPDTLRQADMIEIRIGQGANAGCGTFIPPDHLTPEMAADMGLSGTRRQGGYIPAGVPEAKNERRLRRLVQSLRQLSGGVPIAVKLAANHELEQDLLMAVRAGVDVVVLDGAQGGTQSAPAILVDDFGLPTLSALCRAVQFLRSKGWRDKVDLIISGGLRTPGDMLKALALGADAVYIGTAALFATTHTQIVKAIPFEPPTSLAWATGAHRQQFDEEEGAQSLARFLNSCAEEMKTGVRALGKKSVHDVCESDLVAWNADVARITKLPLI
ncbi:FMN-binding glutamate synthase family protein [Alicyclobacillus kakegawensis]|uniref:FMN-binding glutamate synthase family protein n=1 Tax=Alicyclobacillus kakegawensis TaxID=392012 RepID=UPI000A43BD6C|nr:FMN-binding glutamate synthase family protein [Alicyclobacillus kakegawensis]